MTLAELKERVAHCCDELQVSEESYFFTAANGILRELEVRFPLARKSEYVIEVSDTEKKLVMAAEAEDFRSFARPSFILGDGYIGKAPEADPVCGEVIFPPQSGGTVEIYYEAALPVLTRDTEDVVIDPVRGELLVTGTAYRLLLIDGDYNAASALKRIFDEALAQAVLKEASPMMRIRNTSGW